MSIAGEITRLQTAKSDLATSIANKGVTVPASATLDDYAALVDSIQTGGGGGSTLPYDAEVEWIGVRQGAWTEPSDYVPTGRGISIDMVATFLKYTTASGYELWFVARTDSSHLSYRVFRNNANNKLVADMANTDANGAGLQLTLSSNTTYHLHLDDKVFNITPVNGSTTSANINTNHTGTANTSGFLIGDNGPTRGTELNVYSFTVRNYGTVVLDYVPVRVGQVGYFYDRISGKLYGKNTNSTTDLVVGSDKV